jgi:hypothetical protein
MKSLSVVGCSIDSRGLVELGVKNNAISRTLQDLHLSNALKYSRNFHPTFRQTHSSQMSKRSQALERDKEKFQPINLESEFLSVPSVIMDRQWSLPEDNDSSFADDETDQGTYILWINLILFFSELSLVNGGLGKVLNLRKIIFGDSVRIDKICSIYLR